MRSNSGHVHAALPPDGVFLQTLCGIPLGLLETRMWHPVLGPECPHWITCPPCRRAAACTWAAREVHDS